MVHVPRSLPPSRVPYAAEVLRHPSAQHLAALAVQEQRWCRRTRGGGVAWYTTHRGPIPRGGRGVVARQAGFIAQRGKLLALAGYVRRGARFLAVEWLSTLEGAGLAGMQQAAMFSRAQVESAAALRRPFDASLRVVHTPGCAPDDPAAYFDPSRATLHIVGADSWSAGADALATALGGAPTLRCTPTRPSDPRAAERSGAWLEDAWVDASGRVDLDKDLLHPADVERLRSLFLARGADDLRLAMYIAEAVELSMLFEDGDVAPGWDFVEWRGPGVAVPPPAAPA